MRDGIAQRTEAGAREQLGKDGQGHGTWSYLVPLLMKVKLRRAILLFDPFAGPGKFSAEDGDEPLIHEYLL